MLECVERLRRWTTKQCFTHAFRPFSHGQSRLHLGINLPEERRRQLAVALLRNTDEKPRARSASTRLQVVDRQDGADGCAVSDTGPVETAAGHQRSEN